MIDANKIKNDFPMLSRRPLIYLDSAATSQKPKVVIDAIENYYNNLNANVNRGVYKLAEEATQAYEQARENIRKFINAKNTKEIIFVRNATEGINLVMYSWGMENIKKGDLIVLTEMEHHSNLVPWQQLAKMKEAKLEYVRIDENGLLRQDDIKNLLDKNPKLLAIIHCSNVLGTINDVKSICQQAHRKGTVVVVDAAQSVPHMQVDVQDIGCDFLVFSGHKMLGPMGIGVLYGKESLLDKMKPFMYGGDMIREVDLYETRFNGLPNKFEAGTPNVEGVIGLSVAIDYLDSIGMKNIREHEYELTKYALEKMRKIKGLRILGPTDPKLRLGVIAFTLEGIHPHDVGQIFDEEGLAVRSGTHCAIPLHKKFNVPASTRASFYVYNTKEDIDKMILAIEKSKKVFRL